MRCSFGTAVTNSVSSLRFKPLQSCKVVVTFSPCEQRFLDTESSSDSSLRVWAACQSRCLNSQSLPGSATGSLHKLTLCYIDISQQQQPGRRVRDGACGIMLIGTERRRACCPQILMKLLASSMCCMWLCLFFELLLCLFL